MPFQRYVRMSTALILINQESTTGGGQKGFLCCAPSLASSLTQRAIQQFQFTNWKNSLHRDFKSRLDSIFNQLHFSPGQKVDHLLGRSKTLSKPSIKAHTVSTSEVPAAERQGQSCQHPSLLLLSLTIDLIVISPLYPLLKFSISALESPPRACIALHWN